MVVLAFSFVSSWAGEAPWSDDPIDVLLGPPWERFLVNADRVAAGTVRSVRLIPHPHGPITEVVLEVDQVFFGDVGKTVTVVLHGDAMSCSECVTAPHQGDSIIATISPWGFDPTVLQMHRYVGSRVTGAGRVATVDEQGTWIGSIDCRSGMSVAGPEETLWGPDAVPRSPWDGPDPERVATIEAAALDWTGARAKVTECLLLQMTKAPR
ncbi:MAG: hypothetical protein ABMB14_28550 [Myxococcota bacterium]